MNGEMRSGSVRTLHLAGRRCAGRGGGGRRVVAGLLDVESRPVLARGRRNGAVVCAGRRHRGHRRRRGRRRRGRRCGRVEQQLLHLQNVHVLVEAVRVGRVQSGPTFGRQEGI